LQGDADIEAVAEMLIRVSQIAIDHAEIRMLEIDARLDAEHGLFAIAVRLRVPAPRGWRFLLTPRSSKAARRCATAPRCCCGRCGRRMSRRCRISRSI